MSNTSSRLKIKDLPPSERPYEKMEKFGAQVLSNAELLAIIIRTGSRNETSIDLASRILKKGEGQQNLDFLHHLTLEQLMTIKGIGRVKALQIKALIEFSKRMSSSYGNSDKVIIKGPEDVSLLLMEEMRHLKREVFKVVLLNTKNHVIRHINISIGSLNASIAHPREVFNEAVKASCSAIILVHNHPSGDAEPSKEDIETTARLVEAGNILGIRVLDHIIIGNGLYVSLRERGAM
jgi:DNA repair protein RadC